VLTRPVVARDRQLTVEAVMVAWRWSKAEAEVEGARTRGESTVAFYWRCSRVLKQPAGGGGGVRTTCQGAGDIVGGRRRQGPARCARAHDTGRRRVQGGSGHMRPRETLFGGVGRRGRGPNIETWASTHGGTDRCARRAGERRGGHRLAFVSTSPF
jgi:hypothetical protein